jgi:hypothetical protein
LKRRNLTNGNWRIQEDNGGTKLMEIAIFGAIWIKKQNEEIEDKGREIEKEFGIWNHKSRKVENLGWKSNLWNFKSMEELELNGKCFKLLSRQLEDIAKEIHHILFNLGQRNVHCRSNGNKKEINWKRKEFEEPSNRIHVEKEHHWFHGLIECKSQTELSWQLRLCKGDSSPPVQIWTKSIFQVLGRKLVEFNWNAIRGVKEEINEIWSSNGSKINWFIEELNCISRNRVGSS